MKKNERRKRGKSKAQGARIGRAARRGSARKAHRADLRGLPRVGLRGRPSTEVTATQAKGDQRLLPAACGDARAACPVPLRYGASPAEPARSEMAARVAGGEAPPARRGGCPDKVVGHADTIGAKPNGISASPDTIGMSGEVLQAPYRSGTEQAPCEESGPAAGMVSVAIAAQQLGVSRRTVQYLLVAGRLKGWRLRPRGWWRVTRESLARLGAERPHAETIKGSPKLDEVQ